MILKHQSDRSPFIIGNIFIFLAVVTPRRPGISDKELEVFLTVVKSLLNFGATVMPTGHPLHKLLRCLARWETEDMESFEWDHLHTCHTVGKFFRPNFPARETPVEVETNQSRRVPESHSSTEPTRLIRYYNWLAERQYLLHSST